MRPYSRLRARPIDPAVASIALLAAVAGYVAVITLDVGSDGFVALRDGFMYNAIILAAALFCLLRPLTVDSARLPWALVGLGLLAWVIGDLYYEIELVGREHVPFPSVADAFYLLLYPFVYVGLGLLLRSRLRDVRSDLWLDGVIAGLTIAAVGAALVFGVIVDATGGEPLTVLTNLAYPVADLGLLAVVTVVLAMTGWHLDRAWACVLLGSVVFSVSDCVYLYQTAVESYEQGTMVDVGWAAGIALIAIAAWQPTRPMAAVRVDGFWVLALPTAFGSLALGLLVYDHFRPMNTFALLLVTCALAAVIARMALTFRRNGALLRASLRDAESDALTGLANRRRLMADLEACTSAHAPALLLLFDLDGFKAYNDAFGHPAGDSLLRRLAQKLDAATAPFGRAYRMGGDEFCVLAIGDASRRGAVVASAAKALEDEGEGFRITSAYGSVVLPDETADLSEALRLVDTRMYGNKDSRRASASRQTKDVLLSVLNERDAGLRGHLNGVAALARAVGERLGLAEDDLHQLTLVAELHDVGKLAVPDGILSKPGPLSEDEWIFVHRHTVIGERILAAAPALAPAARLVRATHERIDGLGYPDGLVGDEIPLLSRIVAACDAYYAMTEVRPYRRALAPQDAIAELRRCAGTQFDEDVVNALVDARRSLGVKLVA